MGSYKKYDSVYRDYRSGGNVYFPAAGGYAGSEDRIPEILPGSILPSVDHFHGSCSDRMAWIYNPDYGLLNYFLSLFGIKGPKWLLDANTSLISLAIVGIWKRAGYDMIIFLSGLQGISNSYYEASMLDGANKWQQFRYITLPMLKPTTFFVFVMAVISSFQVFDQVMLMTKGGPGRSSSVLVHYLYQNAFQYFKLGYACAIAYLLFFIVMGVTVVNMRMEKSMREIY